MIVLLIYVFTILFIILVYTPSTYKKKLTMKCVPCYSGSSLLCLTLLHLWIALRGQCQFSEGEYMLSMSEALSLIPSTRKKKYEKDTTSSD
jgi:hypothetical protein